MSTAAPHGVPVGFEVRRQKRDRARHGVSGLLVIAAGAFGVLGGCPAAPTAAETITLDVAFDRTGTLRSSGAFTPMTSGGVIGAGDSAENQELRAFISLSLSTLPATANVTSVILRFTAQNALGNPFGDFPACVVDHVNVVSGINANVFSEEGTLTSAIALVDPIPPLTRRVVEVDVTAAVNADRSAGRPISSFRIFFAQAPTIDGQSDGIIIPASPDDPAGRPSAVVTIRP